MKLIKWLLVALWGVSASVLANFCPLEQPELSEKEQDKLFVAAMFEAEFVFRGKLFSFYDDQCDGEICTWGSLVFKRLEDIEGFSNPYIEGDWVEDCDKLWLHPMAWRSDKSQATFKINSEYLVLAVETPTGFEFIGSRGGLKVKQLMMQYELARISVED